jgi:hypothetical protein
MPSGERARFARPTAHPTEASTDRACAGDYHYPFAGVHDRGGKVDPYAPGMTWHKIKSRTYAQGEAGWEFQKKQP